jgi:hypothetical protein
MENMKVARAERSLVYYSTAQRKALRTLSKRTGVSQAAMIRRGIDLVIAEASKTGKRRGTR